MSTHAVSLPLIAIKARERTSFNDQTIWLTAITATANLQTSEVRLAFFFRFMNALLRTQSACTLKQNLVAALNLTPRTPMVRAHAQSAESDHKTYQIKKNCKLHLQIGDITKWSGDAIVNAGVQASCNRRKARFWLLHKAIWSYCQS